MKNGKLKFNFNIKKRLLPVILLSVCLPLILFVAIPFEVYANNMDEFLFSLSSFFPLCVLFGLLFAAAIACSLLFLPEKAYRITYALVLALSFMFFFQGTFLNFGMDSLAGDNMSSSPVHIGLQVLDAFIWLAVFGAAIAFAIIKDKKGIFAIIAVILSVVVIATQIITPISSTVKHPDVFLSRYARILKEQPDYKDKVVTNENLTTVSGGRNIFYFCIDRFDEVFAEAAYEKEPEIFDGLDGFTWFKDNLSLYGHTFPSVAYMLTENKFNIELRRKENLDAAYADNNTLSLLAQNGYNINLYTSPYYAYNTAHTLPDYISNVSATTEFKTTNPMKLMGCMIGTAAYRCMPLFFKSLIYGIESATFNECVSSKAENGYGNYSTGNGTVYDLVSESAFEEKGDKNFSFIHVDGCHKISLGHLTNNVSAIQKSMITSSVSISFDIINEYLQVLKDKGLYEDATIIITGDHPDPGNNNGAPEKPKLTALFFKPSGSAGEELVQSYAPVEHKNIWPTIFQSENIARDNKGVETLYDIAEGDTTRERTHIYNTYQSSQCELYTFKITGPGTDFDNWELVHTDYLDHFIMD